MNFDPKEIIKNLPHEPGVYRFYSASGDLLYIGKAKNLKNRVSSYFQEGRPKNQRLSLMISQIQRIEYTVVKTEKESLILEANLIHKLQPKYNILLKDDRSYLYVRLTNGDPIPGFFLTRRKYDPRSDYFGPYTKLSGIVQTMRTLRLIFPYCQEKFPQKKACSYVGIKQCDGICAGLESKQDYLKKLDQIKNILNGKTAPAENFLSQKMQEAASVQNFELAALWRDRLKMLTETIADQKIILPHPQDVDLVTLVVDEPDGNGLQVGSVFVQTIRQGKIINVNNFLLSGSEGESDNQSINSFLERFLVSYYSARIEDCPVLVQAFYRDLESV